MKISKHWKRIISVVMTVAVFVSTLCVVGTDAFAQFGEAVQSAVANAVNSINGIVLTADQETCNHYYIVTKTYNSPNCTKSGYVTSECKKCGKKITESKPLGHQYTYTSDMFHGFTYKCKFCTSTISADSDSLMRMFDANINYEPVRGNDNCLIDVVSDGIINVKDLAKIRKNSDYKLANPNANEKTKQIYRYLCNINAEQKYTISAQQESTWMGSVDYEINYIMNHTGKYPAMRGLDYMNDDFYGVNQRAIDWWNRGGLVTICWHTGSDFSGEWNDAMNDTVSNWDAMLTPGTNEYNQMIAGMDKAARALQELQNRGVTVLWRPFHEFDGGWFWWGKGTARNFKAMWQIMYDRYTKYWGLNNLIWVLGYSHNGSNMALWDPGADYYDIIGADTYDLSELNKLYTGLTGLGVYGKPVCLHECGANPSNTQFNNYPFAYFMTWHTNYLTDENSTAELSQLYNSQRIITLDELDYSKY